MSRTLLLAALIATSTTACSTSYVPRTPGRLFVTMDSGKPSYVRDGQRYDHGLFGGGLVEAVHGHPQAEAAAEEYNGRMRNGFIASMLGTLCAGIAFGAGIAANDEGDSRADTYLLGAAGCTVVMFGGLFYMASAEPYRWDAINIFNDSPPAPVWGPGPAYGALESVSPISSRAAAKTGLSFTPAAQ